MKRIILSAMLMGAMLPASALFAEGTVQRRQKNQQKRIGEGVENGSLSPAEAARLERQEARIHNEVKSERQANGGTLTPKEKARVARQQNRESRRIYRQKHDGNNK